MLCIHLFSIVCIILSCVFSYYIIFHILSVVSLLIKLLTIYSNMINRMKTFWLSRFIYKLWAAQITAIEYLLSLHRLIGEKAWGTYKLWKPVFEILVYYLTFAISEYTTNSFIIKPNKWSLLKRCNNNYSNFIILLIPIGISFILLVYEPLV